MCLTRTGRFLTETRRDVTEVLHRSSSRSSHSPRTASGGTPQGRTRPERLTEGRREVSSPSPPAPRPWVLTDGAANTPRQTQAPSGSPRAEAPPSPQGLALRGRGGTGIPKGAFPLPPWGEGQAAASPLRRTRLRKSPPPPSPVAPRRPPLTTAPGGHCAGEWRGGGGEGSAAGPVAAATGGRRPAPEGPAAIPWGERPPAPPPPPGPAAARRGDASLSAEAAPAAHLGEEGAAAAAPAALTHPPARREMASTARPPAAFPPLLRLGPPLPPPCRPQVLPDLPRPGAGFAPRRAPPASPRVRCVVVVSSPPLMDCHISGCWDRWLWLNSVINVEELLQELGSRTGDGERCIPTYVKLRWTTVSLFPCVYTARRHVSLIALYLSYG